MHLPRFIPKQVFQTIALLTLLVCLVASIQLCIEDLPPYAWLTGLGELFAWVLTVALAVLVWGGFVLPLRLLSTMPTYAEELAEAGAANMGELYAQQQRQLQSDRRRDNGRWHAMMCLAGGLVAGVLGLVVAIFWFFEGLLLGAMGIGAVASGVLSLWHFAQVLLRLFRPRADPER